MTKQPDHHKKVKHNLYKWEGCGFDSEKEFLERYPNAPRTSLLANAVVVDVKSKPSPTRRKPNSFA